MTGMERVKCGKKTIQLVLGLQQVRLDVIFWAVGGLKLTFAKCETFLAGIRTFQFFSGRTFAKCETFLAGIRTFCENKFDPSGSPGLS